MTADRVNELLVWAEKVFSLDAPLSEEEENTLGDIIEDTRNRSPMEITDQQLLREEIRKVLSNLTLREQVLALGDHLPHDEDGFRLEALKVRQWCVHRSSPGLGGSQPICARRIGAR